LLFLRQIINAKAPQYFVIRTLPIFKFVWDYYLGAIIRVKCGAGEGWRRSVGPIMWEMKKHYL